MAAENNRISHLRLLVDELAAEAGGKLRAAYRAIATSTGLDEEYIYQLYKGVKKTLGPDAAKAIARAYANGRPMNWIDLPPTSTMVRQDPSRPREHERKSVPASPVPLISWQRAALWADQSDPAVLGEVEEWLHCPAKHGARTYCLRVRGDSMHNPSGKPSYADGDIIFVDPDRAVEPGDRVIVRLADQQDATFKQLLLEDGRKLLKALNPEWTPRYTEINGESIITGVVIGKWVAE